MTIGLARLCPARVQELTWINKAGSTKVQMRSESQIANNAPVLIAADISS